jgi:glutaminyl-peptide cyclotransferase
VLAFTSAVLLTGAAGRVLAQPSIPTPRSPADNPTVHRYRYEIVRTYPQDSAAFTQGLFYLGGYLYESTGLVSQSSIRRVELRTGRVLQNTAIAAPYFGEGIVNWKNRLISLTWQHHVGWVFDLEKLTVRSEFHYDGEGWGLTQDGQRLIMSDGTAVLRLIDPETLRQTGHIDVTYQGKPVGNLNELEWIKGEIYANVWLTDWIVRIDPSSGRVVGLVDLKGLLSESDRQQANADVLNGIAYDGEHDRLFVTGKRWPKLFEIRLVPEKTG